VSDCRVRHGEPTGSFLLEPRARQHVRGSGTLHDGAVGRGLTAHEERNANRAVIADNCDLGRGAVLEHVQKRDDGVDRKIDVTQCRRTRRELYRAAA